MPEHIHRNNPTYLNNKEQCCEMTPAGLLSNILMHRGYPKTINKKLWYKPTSISQSNAVKGQADWLRTNIFMQRGCRKTNRF